MSDPERRPQDGIEAEACDRRAESLDAPAAPAFDWQVLLLRYLPEPAGSAHAVKRLSAR
jgi:hypothetical protein